jgi:UDPglucose--hexose-1-phosphate uridylyltransferase
LPYWCYYLPLLERFLANIVYMKSSNFSSIQFRREIMPSRILKRDSSGELAEVTIPLEFRFDPLTGQSCRLVQFPPERIIRPDLVDLEQRSLELTCPFCPPLVEKITPRFPPELIPEGTIRIGKATAFPNAGPYDVYGTVVVISDEHFVRLGEFTLETVLNALLATYSYIRRVQEVDPEAKYHFIAWNYMPPSGGSLVHPHMQGNIGYFPTSYQKQILEASQQYYKEMGTNYWKDLVEQERQRGERYIGTIGNTHWLTSFVPKGRLSDVLAIFPGKASIAELTEDDLHDFATGLLRTFSYLDELNLLSFNLATYSGFDKKQFWAHARITPRGLLLYSPIETSDQFYYQILHDENICILPPEVACEKLKKHFSG